jgi:phage terminase large subunit
MRQAQLNDAYVKKTIYDNPRLNEDDINRIAEALGGVNSVDFRREYLVELITSEEDAIIPEFNPKTKAELVRNFDHPHFYDAYVSMDLGVRDLTVVLFGFYDFKTATVFIEDEIVMSGKELITDVLASRIATKESSLWTNPQTGEPHPPMLRVSDNNNLMLLNELQIKHNLLFLPSRKDGLDAAINNVRMLVKQKRLIINPRCTTLINHLETGIWNKSKTSFARSSDKGHFDAIHSLIYLVRNIDFSRNPYPADYRGNMSNYFFMSEPTSHTTTKFESDLKALIRKRNPFKKSRF